VRESLGPAAGGWRLPEVRLTSLDTVEDQLVTGRAQEASTSAAASVVTRVRAPERVVTTMSQFPFSSVARAMRSPVGPQAGLRSEPVPAPSRRFALPFTFMIHSWERLPLLRTKATCLPSGESAGVASSVAGALVRFLSWLPSAAMIQTSLSPVRVL
jgi:hypothetical protein